MLPERKNLLTSWRHGIGTLAAIALGGAVVVIAAGLWVTQHNQIQTLNTDRARSAAALHQAQSQIQDLTSRLNVLSQRQVQSADRTTEPSVRHAAAPVKRAPRVVAKSDPRFDRLQGQLAETRKELASTREDLTKTQESLDGKINSTRDDLSGSIARTHGDVVALQKRGEQNVYEFHLAKSKQMQRVGPVSLSLRSTSTRHKTYDLSMLVDDNTLNKKHVNLYEPVWITLTDRPQPVQLVVNRVGKDEVDGYVTEPRYKKSDLVTNAEAAAPPKDLPTR